MKGSPLNNPVIYGKRPKLFYMTHNFSGEVSPHGQIFVADSDGEPLTGRNTVLVGHHMKDWSMFGTLCCLVEHKQEVDRFPKAELLYGEKRYEVRWFAGFFFRVQETEPARVHFEHDEDFEMWLNAIRSRSVFQTEIVPNVGDQILTCVTCAFEVPEELAAVYGLLQEI